MTEENQPNAQPADTAPVFLLEKIYVQDLSIEVPHAPGIFLEQGEPKIDIQLNNVGGLIQGNLFSSILTVTVNAKLGEKTVFCVEVKQAGIFRLHNIPPAEVEPLLAVSCPNILLPYAREAISEATMRAGFPPVYIQPVNFDGIYRAQLQEREKQQAGQNTEAG
ncbi:MAG: protein-export chaperone SecB [Zoogloeaceae bacterium]|jgi:preprotein translocase subunit SecB|nr:protein-export chaperone SecB [Zoogloeaceae bacterium]